MPVSPKKEEPSAATVTVTVAETRLQTEIVNQVFPSTVVTEVSVIPAGNKLASVKSCSNGWYISQLLACL